MKNMVKVLATGVLGVISLSACNLQEKDYDTLVNALLDMQSKGLL